MKRSLLLLSLFVLGGSVLCALTAETEKVVSDGVSLCLS